ncbi:hypothetical protein L7F22_032015 [Adiantum nelumboides]|nr:hypothetical protein [Adiantum nelumboides]
MEDRPPPQQHDLQNSDTASPSVLHSLSMPTVCPFTFFLLVLRYPYCISWLIDGVRAGLEWAAGCIVKQPDDGGLSWCAQSFDHGYYVMVLAIQEFRDKKKGPVAVGIGGPCGSGKSSLASKVAAIFGGAVIAMEHYQDPSIAPDDSKELDMIDFSLLRNNLEGLLQGNDIAMPQFDFQQKKRKGYKVISAPESGVVIVEGTYAMNERLRPYLDLKVAVVGGVHYNLISKVHRDIGEKTPIDQLIDGIFPSFRRHIEPDLQHAQISISNSFKSSLREPFYILKMYKEQIKKPIDAFYDSQMHYERSLEIYLTPPNAMDQSQITEWIKMRQCGIRYDAGWGDQRIVDKQFIIKPRVEFEVRYGGFHFMHW